MVDAIFLLAIWGMVFGWLMFQSTLQVPVLHRLLGISLMLAMGGCMTWKVFG